MLHDSTSTPTLAWWLDNQFTLMGIELIIFLYSTPSMIASLDTWWSNCCRIKGNVLLSRAVGILTDLMYCITSQSSSSPCCALPLINPQGTGRGSTFTGIYLLYNISATYLQADYVLPGAQVVETNYLHSNFLTPPDISLKKKNTGKLAGKLGNLMLFYSPKLRCLQVGYWIVIRNHCK